MGNPILSAPKIPVNTSLSEIISYPLEIENNTFNITCVSMGNPHTVIFLNEMERYDLHHIGALIEHLNCSLKEQCRVCRNFISRPFKREFGSVERAKPSLVEPELVLR